MKKIFLLLTFLIFVVFALKAQNELELHTLTGTIYGTLQLPSASNKAIPIVLIISGSGPTDRDGNNVQMQNNSLKMLADSLQIHGIASLRYDKRGIAASKDAGSEESDLRFDQYIDDAAGWIRLLKKDIRFSKIIVAGHSEGSLIGMNAAYKTNADGYISIAGAGRSADVVLKEQLSSQPESIKKDCYSIIDSLVAGKTVNAINPVIFSLFRPSVQPYMISWFRHDPQKEIKKLTVPVLILQGSTDLQVGEVDARLLGVAAPKATVSIIEGMNHILKPASMIRQENLATYSDPTIPIHANMILEIKRFLSQFF